MQVVDKYGNTFGQGHLIITSKSGKSKLPVVTVAWGNITGALIDQTDLQDALNLKVPTARTITINGVTQDLTANRTWTISTGITVDTTPITGGVAGRVLFEGVGNVVQESPNFLWDNTNGRITVNAITNGAVAIFKNSTNGLTIYPQSTQVQVYSDYFGAGTDKPLIFGTYSNRTNQLSLFISGNIGVNTATDAGYKLDVAGSIRTQSSLVIANPSFTLGGSITHSANATLVIAGGPGGGENITIGPSNRIFINAQQSRFPNGSVQIGSTLSVGSANTTAATMLWVTGGVGASSALARGIGLDSTLVAVANNDVLVGLDIAPTYTNGAFTGVSNYVARLGGHIGISTANAFGLNYISFSALTANQGISATYGPNGTPAGYAYNFQFAKSSTSNSNGLLFIGGGASAGGNSANKHIISTSADGTALGQQLVLRTAITGQSWSLVNDHFTIFPGGNVVIQSTSQSATDAGYKLDVNGTARVQGVITGSVSAGSLILGAASANQVGIALNGYFVNSGAISTSNFNARSFNHTIGGQGAGIVSTFNGIAQGITTNCEYFVARGNINLTDGAIDLSGFNFSPTIVSEIGATIRAFSSSLSAGANRWNLFLSGTAKNYIAGNLLIGTTTDVASSKLTVESTTQGFLPPRMSNAQMLAIATPAEGLMVYDTTNRKLCCYDGTTWQNLF